MRSSKVKKVKKVKMLTLMAKQTKSQWSINDDNVTTTECPTTIYCTNFTINCSIYKLSS